MSLLPILLLFAFTTPAFVAAAEGPPPAQADPTASQPERTDSVSLTDLEGYGILAQMPRIAGQFWDFVYEPNEFTRTWKMGAGYRVNPLATLGWCLSIVALIHGIYHVVFRRPPFYINYEDKAESQAFAVVSLGFIRFGWAHPQYRGPDEPTLALYYLGLATVGFKDVKPSWLSSRPARMFLVALGATTFALSTLPISWIWVAPQSIMEVISFYSIVMVYSLFAA